MSHKILNDTETLSKIQKHSILIQIIIMLFTIGAIYGVAKTTILNTVNGIKINTVKINEHDKEIINLKIKNQEYETTINWIKTDIGEVKGDIAEIKDILKEKK